MKSRGFTLLEVLIALAVLAVALAAALRATAVSTDAAHSVKQKMLAEWCAENRMAEQVARRAWLAPGEQSVELQQADMTFTSVETVTATPNAAFRRIAIKVYAGDKRDYALAQLVGYLSNPEAK